MQNEYDSKFHDIIAVRRGLYANNCLFFSWNDAAIHVANFPKAIYKGFRIQQLEEAAEFVRVISMNTWEKRASLASIAITKSPVVSSNPLKPAGTESIAQAGNTFTVPQEALDFLPNQREKPAAKVAHTQTHKALHPAAFAASTVPLKPGAIMEDNNAGAKADSFFNSPVPPVASLKPAALGGAQATVTSLKRQRTSHETLPDISATKTRKMNEEKPASSENKQHKIWMVNLQKLKAYKDKHGSCNIDSSDDEHEDLRQWVRDQNSQYENFKSKKSSSMSNEKISMLQDIGFPFTFDRKKPDASSDIAMTEWERKKWEEICTDTTVLGDDVSTAFSPPERFDNASIAIMDHFNLTKNDSIASNISNLTPGMVWMSKFDLLKEYKSQRGNFDVDKSSEEHKALLTFIKTQNENYKAFKMKKECTPLTERKIQMLKDIGFVFAYDEKTDEKQIQGPEDAKWEEMFQILKRFKENHGTLKLSLPLSKTSSELTALYNWIAVQKAGYKRLSEGKANKLTAVRLKKLYDLGFQFPFSKKRVPWEERMRQLREYKQSHGHLRVPTTHPVLGSFVAHTRLSYHKYINGETAKGTMNEDRLRDLTEIGFIFSVVQKKSDRNKGTIPWEERFNDLLRYKEEHGNLNVKQNDPSGLGHWVHTLRKNYKLLKEGKSGGSLTTERALRLNDIGFEFVRETRAPRKDLSRY